MLPAPRPQPSSHFWQTLNNSVLPRYLLLFASAGITVLLINYFYHYSSRHNC